MELNEMERMEGVDWNGDEWDGMECYRVERSGVQKSIFELNGMKRNLI